MSNLEKLKIKFLSLAKTAELTKLDSELAKLSYIPQNEKEKFVNKCNSALKDAKEAEKNYLAFLQIANETRCSYIEGSKHVLDRFEILEEEFIKYNKNIMQKFYIFSNATFKNILFDTEKAYSNVEHIDTRIDIDRFIIKNKSNQMPPEEIEYVPYSIMLRNKSTVESNYPVDVVYNVIVTMQSLFVKVENEYVFLF